MPVPRGAAASVVEEEKEERMRRRWKERRGSLGEVQVVVGGRSWSRSSYERVDVDVWCCCG